MKCICCSGELPEIFDTNNHQPNGGTEFTGGGVYGSSVTDKNTHRFAIYVCDECLKRAGEKGLVETFIPQFCAVSSSRYRMWKP